MEIRDKPILYVDLDDTVFELVKPLLKKYNNVYNDCTKYTDIKSWDIHKYINSKCDNIFYEFCNSEFIFNTEPIVNAIDTINKLHELFNIVFLTASHPCLAMARHEKLKKYFNWYDYHTDLVITSNKKLCTGFALIDDGYHNLQGNCSVNNKILINRPWNECYKSKDIKNNIIRVSNWNDIYHILLFLFRNM